MENERRLTDSETPYDVQHGPAQMELDRLLLGLEQLVTGHRPGIDATALNQQIDKYFDHHQQILHTQGFELSNHPFLSELIENSSLIAEIYQQVTQACDLMQLHPNHYPFHNLGHIHRVSEYMLTLMDHYQIDKRAYLVGAIMAICHDCGFSKQYLANEPIGAQMARQFTQQALRTHPDSQDTQLLQEDLDGTIAQIETGILQTDIFNPDVQPQTDLEKMLRDADIHNIFTPHFPTNNHILWLERKRHQHEIDPDSAAPSYQERLRASLSLLDQVKLHTDYQQQTKLANLERNKAYLRQRIELLARST